MAWEFQNGVPIYRQIALRLETEIAAGKYEAGQQMPSVRDLAVEAGVNPNTMQRALALLETDGILFSVRTSGRFVTKEEMRLKDLRNQLAEEEIAALFGRLKAIGMTRQEIIGAISRWGDRVL